MAPRPSPAVTLAAGLLPVPVPVSARLVGSPRRARLIAAFKSLHKGGRPVRRRSIRSRGRSWFSLRSATELSRRKEPWRRSTNSVPSSGLVVELGADPPERGVPRSPVEAAFDRPPRRPRFLTDSCSTATTSWRVATAVVAWWIVGADHGHLGVECARTPRWPLPAFEGSRRVFVAGS